MSEQKIHVLGYDDIVLMLGLLGIEGTVIKESDDFQKEFNNLINKPSIDMIIISLKLPSDIEDFLVNFKLNKRKPFIFYLPEIFNLEVIPKDLFLNKIYESIGKILSLKG